MMGRTADSVKADVMKQVALALFEVGMESTVRDLKAAAGTALLEGDAEAAETLLTVSRMVEGVDRSRHDTDETYLRAATWTLRQAMIELEDLMGKGGNGCSYGNRDGPES